MYQYFQLFPLTVFSQKGQLENSLAYAFPCSEQWEFGYCSATGMLTLTLMLMTGCYNEVHRF